MKALIFFTTMMVLSFSNPLPAQEKSGFEALLSAKVQIENITKKITVLPDTSPAYRKFYNELNNTFIKAAGAYEAYKGSIIDCIFYASSANKSKGCLSEKSINLKDDLDKLFAVTNNAYNEHFGISSVKVDKYSPVKPAGPVNLVPNIISNLVDGGMKIWNVIKDLKGQKKKEYIDQINSSAYVIKSFEEIVQPPR